MLLAQNCLMYAAEVSASYTTIQELTVSSDAESANIFRLDTADVDSDGAGAAVLVCSNTAVVACKIDGPVKAACASCETW